MILTQLKINDFGVFRGEHTFDLSPRQNRPIILFGGKNGAGKSTVLEALRLCLYGSGALGVGVSKEDYLKFLGRKIHTDPNALIQPSFASVQVEFRYSHFEGLATYRVTRSWERRNSLRVSESLTVERNESTLEEIDAEHWQDFLRELIPPGVSQLFFFDGEKIQQLAEDTTDQGALADAIKSLLGLDIVERLQADLTIHFSKLAKPNRNTAQVTEVRNLEREIERLRKKLQNLREKRTEDDGRLADLKAQIVRAESAFISRGGSFARNREHLLQKEAILKERISQLEETIRHECSGLLPFALVPELCSQLRAQLDLENESAQTRAGQAVLDKAKVEITERLKSEALWVGLNKFSASDKHTIQARAINLLSKPLRVEQTRPVESVHNLSEADSRTLLQWIDQALSSIPQTMKAVYSELEKAHRELHKVVAVAKRVPSDDVIKPVLDEIHRLNEKLVLVSAQLLLKDANASEVELQLLDCERRHGNLATKLAAEAKYSGTLALLPRVQGTLEEYRVKLIEKKVTQLQLAVTECFNMLCRKKDSLRTIKINSKDFSVTLCDRQNRPVPKVQLSAGEKQIYAISMLWALGKTSGRPLPVIIDTPLARLDSDHRKLLVEHYFPLASHQVIILSTDTEIDQVYFDALRPAVARAYHLDYEQAESTTVIKEGYFWRDRDEAYKTAVN